MLGRKKKTIDRVADIDIVVEARGIENGDAVAVKIVKRIADIGDILKIGNGMNANATEVTVADPGLDLVVETTTDAVRIPVLEVGLVGKMRNIRDDDAWRGVIRLRLVGGILSAGEIGMIVTGGVDLLLGLNLAWRWRTLFKWFIECVHLSQ